MARKVNSQRKNPFLNKKCFECSEEGHIIINCPNKKNDKSKKDKKDDDKKRRSSSSSPSYNTFSPPFAIQCDLDKSEGASLMAIPATPLDGLSSSSSSSSLLTVHKCTI